jgi:serine/threonine protein kinase/formylglycine-generating enzyme required for sulfatase activity
MSETPAQPGNSEATPRRRFGHFELIKELGRGAQGVVYLAEDTLLGRRVALKLLVGSGAQSKEVRERFQREGKITSRLNHPGICALYEVGEVENIPFLAMQYVKGRTLAELLTEARAAQQLSADSAVQTISVMGRSSKGEMEDVLRLLEKVARALHVAHEAGLVHRDVKPHNIMVDEQGDPVLLDFGLARDLDAEGQTLTASGAVMGTPAYLAPEQIVADREHIDRRTDIYALGVTLFECLTLQRPYDAPSWDQLYHKILEAAVPNPCKLNPRIPRDIRTVIEVAMERESRRRYASALLLAEDLRRVRSFEPIQAQAANLWIRLRKWARRRPGIAATVTAATVLVGAGVGSLVYREVEQQRMVGSFLRTAEQKLAAGEFAAAREALAQARTWDDGSVEAVAMVAVVDAAERTAAAAAAREQAMREAAAARDRSRAAMAAYREVQQELVAVRTELARRSDEQKGRFAPEAARREFASLEARLAELQVRARQQIAAAEDQLQLAARVEAPFGGVSATTEEQFADHYVERWREAMQSGTAPEQQVLQNAVVRHDRDRRYERELFGRGELTVACAVPGAELYLFRFVDHASVRRTPVVPRLVPLPTRGVDDASAPEWPWPGDFVPGDPCLVVTAVADGSLAAAAGLQPGDLVVAIAGQPATGVFVGRNLDTAEPALHAVRDVDGTAIASPFDLALLPEGAEPRRVGIAGTDQPLELAQAAATFWSAAQLATAEVPVARQLGCLRGGRYVPLVLPSGVGSGLTVETTAYPLVCGDRNRITADTPLPAEHGSYLVVARAAGHETARLPTTVPRLGSRSVTVDLLPVATTPPGFVHVPGGPFPRGRDEAALQPAEGGEFDVPGFWIEAREHRNTDYYEFLNDPEVRTRITASLEQKQPILLPRDVDGKVLARQQQDGSWTWNVHTHTTGESPVLGVSWRDVAEYLQWRNTKAPQYGPGWRYDLPTADEWEKAARGVDGRHFPWGDRFDPALTVCLHHRAQYLLDAPGGSEPRDASVYGVLDLAGSREEWTGQRVPDRSANQTQATYHKLGGSWSVAAEMVFRSASRPFAGELRAAAQVGFRVVLRRQ